MVDVGVVECMVRWCGASGRRHVPATDNDDNDDYGEPCQRAANVGHAEL